MLVLQKDGALGAPRNFIHYLDQPVHMIETELTKDSKMPFNIEGRTVENHNAAPQHIFVNAHDDVQVGVEKNIRITEADNGYILVHPDGERDAVILNDQAKIIRFLI